MHRGNAYSYLRGLPVSTSSYDCKTLNPLDPGTPYYHECFGFFQLPTAFQFEAGPFTDVQPPPYPPNVACPLLSKAQRTGQLSRDSDCEFVYSWSDGDFSIFLAINENKVPLTTKLSLNNADMVKWRVGGLLTEQTKTAYCNVTLTPGSVTLEIIGTISNDVCAGPFRIWFDPTISPLTY